MNTPDIAPLIQSYLTNSIANKQKTFLIFSGDFCSWCDKLRAALSDGKLEEYTKANGINLHWIKLQRKEDELKACENSSCSIPPRSKYQIKSLPTAILFDEKGSELARTEFIDDCLETGSHAYITWLENESLF